MCHGSNENCRRLSKPPTVSSRLATLIRFLEAIPAMIWSAMVLEAQNRRKIVISSHRMAGLFDVFSRPGTDNRGFVDDNSDTYKALATKIVISWKYLNNKILFRGSAQRYYFKKVLF